MILVLFGTQDKPFDRLLDYVLKAAEENVFSDKDKIYLQIGQMEYDKNRIKENEKYKKLNFFSFKPFDELQKDIKNAKYIITHAGAGSMVDIAKKNKKMIIVPRRIKYNEHVNDHQIQLAEKFEEKKHGILVHDYTSFKEAIKDIDAFENKKYESNNEMFCKGLDSIIKDLLKNKKTGLTNENN